MVATNGNNISKAFTNGVEVRTIYNNGVKVWPTYGPIPPEYTRLTWISNGVNTTGDETIIPAGILLNSNFTFTENTSIEMEVKRLYTSKIGDYNVFYISEKGRSDYALHPLANIHNNVQTDAAFILSERNNGILSNIQYNFNTLYKIIWTPSHIYVNGTELVTQYITTPPKTGVLSILNPYHPRLKMMMYTGSNNALYNFKVKEGDTLIYDLYPVRRNSDNEIGLYDIVNEKFYSKHSSCTLNFTYGN